MGHFFGNLHTSENEIIVLCAVKLSAKASHLFHQTFTHHKEMTDIVIRSEQIQIKIRLQVRLKMLTQVHRHLILIRIDHIRVLLLQSLNHLVERIRRQQVIVVQKS